MGITTAGPMVAYLYTSRWLHIAGVTSSTMTTRKHMVLFPFPAQGHLVAFMSAAGLLRRTLPDVAITVVSTPRNVAALQASSADASSIGFHALPFAPVDHNLPVGCESSDTIPASRSIMDLFEAFEMLQPAFDDYVAGAAADGDVCVLSDPFLAWTVNVARRHGCGHAFFVSCGAFGVAVLHSLFSHLPVSPDATGRVHLLEYPEVVIDKSQVSKNTLRPSTGGIDRGAAFMQREIPLGYKSDAVLINSVEEFEPTGLAMLRRTLKLPVWPIGPLVRATSGSVVSPENDDAVLVSFLDSQPPASVLYISFGSQASIRAEHMMELAAAMESTGRPFVWAIKPPDGHDIKGEFLAEWLPDGFEERTRASKKGFLVRSWAPQVKILAHASTGAFLSHCGWNSVLESMAHGVPIIGWPLASEQFYNAKMLDEEWGVCLEVARGNMNGTAVERARVVDVVDTVLGQTTVSAAMRRRVSEIKDLMDASWKEGDGSSRKAFTQFLKLEAMKLQ